MAQVTDEGLDKKIKSSPIDAYILHGDEDYLKKKYLEKIIKATVDESFEEFNKRIFDGDEVEFDDVVDAVQAVPLMAESKCVVVKNYNPNLIKGKKNELKLLLEDRPEYTCLVFVCSADSKGEDFNETVKLFDKNGISAKLTKKTGNDIIKKLNVMAKKAEREFEIGAAEYLAEYVGTDLNTLINEMTKLCSYCDEKIKKTDIELICTGLLETKVFDMTNDLVAGRYEPAMIKLNRLFAQREEEIVILGAIISQYANMFRAKVTVTTGHTFNEVAEAYPSYNKKTTSLSIASRNAGKLSKEKLAQCLEELAQADMKMKTSMCDKKILLEKTMLNLMRK